MSTAKHTPGPWRVENRLVRATKHKQICEVPAYGVVHGKVDEANARLIAAAPELLEALVNLLAVHECEGGTKYHAGDIARAAISKATRETK